LTSVLNDQYIKTNKIFIKVRRRKSKPFSHDAWMNLSDKFIPNSDRIENLLPRKQ